MANSTKKRSTKKSTADLAAQADKYRCYQLSVQDPGHECDFFVQAFKETFKRTPKHLREDFCGTFAVCCDWVKGHKDRTAIGVDLDPEPLSWGGLHNLAPLTKNQKDRVQVIEADVRKRMRTSQARPHKADVLAAQNFSFWLFKSRSELLEYFRAARSHMADESIMVMDMMGGGDCLMEDHKDVRSISGYGKPIGKFKYIWEQARHDPTTSDADFYISFRFKDGSKLSRCFGYHWRFWTIPEVRELLHEAGFAETHVYWEVTEEDGDETGDWERVTEAPSDPSWLAYIVAVK
ncbi:MAG: class I SAM-dependent methyltransferase [Planctomycetota bacterium]